MILKSKFADFFLRVAVGLLIGTLFGWLISDLSYFFTPYKEDAQRAPQRIDLVIPYGTAEQVKQGVGNSSLPANMTFVQGDILVVKNEDVVPHTLGPLFVPPNTSSALTLDTADEYHYTCSFEPSKFIGLDVRQRVEGSTRLQAILAIGLPSGMMLAVYSYLVPFKRKGAETPA